MVKRRNHYIPRVLLRRFAARETSKGQAYLWQLPKGGKTLQLETKNAAVESFFYGDPATGVEDGLAVLETDWRGLLDELDQSDHVDHLRPSLWRLTWLLGVRTRAMRDHWTKTASAVVASMTAARAATMAEAVLREFDCTSDSLWADEQVWEQTLAQFPEEQRVSIRNALNSNQSIKAMVLAGIRKQVSSLAPDLFRKLLGAVTTDSILTGAAKGQVKGLSGILTAAAPFDRLAPESWTVVSFPSHSVVLGDVVSFTVGPDGQNGTVGRFKEDLEAIYLPISHERVLVGHRKTTPLLDLDSINRASASLSSNVIFAARSTETERALTGLIGSTAPMLSDDERDEVVDNVWRNFGKT